MQINKHYKYGQRYYTTNKMYFYWFDRKALNLAIIFRRKNGYIIQYYFMKQGKMVNCASYSSPNMCDIEYDLNSVIFGVNN